VWGIETLSPEMLVLRVVAKTHSNARDELARELRQRLKGRLDELGVRLPVPGQLVVEVPERPASRTRR